MFSYIFSDVSFLVFSPSLQSYVFVHLLFEFSETGAVSVWDDFQSFSGRYSKQFDFSERMTTLRISQYSTLDPNISTVCWYCFDVVNRYVTIIYALMYLFYEKTDWNALRTKIPDVCRHRPPSLHLLHLTCLCFTAFLPSTSST
jgi:hypothetical protein